MVVWNSPFAVGFVALGTWFEVDDGLLLLVGWLVTPRGGRRRLGVVQAKGHLCLGAQQAVAAQAECKD